MINLGPTAKLEAGMTLAKINNSNVTQSVKNKQIELFNKYNTNGDDKIDANEFAAYEKDCTKKKWKTAAWIAGGVLLAGATAFAVWKGIKMNKALKQTQETLAQTQDALAKTGKTLTQTEGVLAETETALTEARQALGYGQGTVKAGDAILENAVVAETKGGKATFQLAEGTEKFPDLWNAKGTMADYRPGRGDMIMGYGPQKIEYGIQNPEVLAEMKAKGLTEFPDHAISADVDIMYQTYIGQDGRDFLTKPLKFGEVVPAQKKIFPAGVAFADAGTSVETIESAAGAGKKATVGVGQFIQVGVKGEPYVKDVNDMIKRLNPGSSFEGKRVFDTIKDFIDKRKGIQASGMSAATKESAIARAWEQTMKSIGDIRSFFVS